MDFRKLKKLLITIAAIYWTLFFMILFIGNEQFHYKRTNSEMLSPSGVIGQLKDGDVVTQTVNMKVDYLDQMSVRLSIYNTSNTGSLNFRFLDEKGQLLGSQSVSLSDVVSSDAIYYQISPSIDVREVDEITVEITTSGCNDQNPVSIFYGNEVSVGKTTVPQNIADQYLYRLNGEAGPGQLCLSLIGVMPINAYLYYIVGGIALFVLAALLCYYYWKQAKEGKNNPLVMAYSLAVKYRFLLNQLVSRDFKTKYKRSVLGMAWSFLNPLLTMMVQYVVFSTLFKSDVSNYPIYLLSGIVFMNYFNEAVSIGMTSITNNASLIKKVYVPKYIYPLSRVISSLINFGLSLVPLFIVMLLTRTGIHFSFFLLIFDILCLLGFITGMSLLLTTCMTFFQDTQFLWGVVSMLWMYLTPVFYPETIIPMQLRTLYHMNPMYQYITFARICIIDGNSPDPTAYLWCILTSVVTLLVGIYVFRKNQDKFILNI